MRRAGWTNGNEMVPETTPPLERRGVPRTSVPAAVKDMLADPRVKWIAILHEDTIGPVDRFLLVSYTSDPAK